VKHLRIRLIAAMSAGFVSIICFGQNAPTFTSAVSPSGPTPFHDYSIDVNNDGLTDIVQPGIIPGATTAFFTVSINNGDGTFRPPVSYTVNAGTRPALASGDFNNDGKVDIAFALPGTNEVAVYLGNGDGTFQSPVTTTINLPSGYHFATSSVVAGDFTHDGSLDLVTAGYVGNDGGYAGPWGIFLLYGDGQGHFNNPSIIYQPTSGWMVDTIVTGDFDSDDNADVAIMEQLPCAGIATTCVGNTYASNVLALFGSGTGSFGPVDVTTIYAAMSLGAADLNNDAATDLYSIEYFPAAPPNWRSFSDTTGASSAPGSPPSPQTFPTSVRRSSRLTSTVRKAGLLRRSQPTIPDPPTAARWSTSSMPKPRLPPSSPVPRPRAPAAINPALSLAILMATRNRTSP
jgi:hypothetical protein